VLAFQAIPILHGASTKASKDWVASGDYDHDDHDGDEDRQPSAEDDNSMVFVNTHHFSIDFASRPSFQFARSLLASHVFWPQTSLPSSSSPEVTTPPPDFYAC
jgi:hypothetical protein